jgi:selenide,water dikinase
VARFDALLLRVRASQGPVSLAVVGGGAGGVELALALAHRLQQERAAAAAVAAAAAGGGASGAASGEDVVK